MLPTVRDYMTTRIRTLTPDLGILKAVDVLLKHKISGAPVVNSENEVVGVLSEKDCLRLVAGGVGGEQPSGTVSEFMSTKIETIPPKMDIYYVAGLFIRQAFRRFPVVEDGKLVGVISRHDVLKAIQKIRRKPPTSEFGRLSDLAD